MFQFGELFLEKYNPCSSIDANCFQACAICRECIILHIHWCIGNLEKTYIGTISMPMDEHTDVWMARCVCVFVIIFYFKNFKILMMDECADGWKFQSTIGTIGFSHRHMLIFDGCCQWICTIIRSPICHPIKDCVCNDWTELVWRKYNFVIFMSVCLSVCLYMLLIFFFLSLFTKCLVLSLLTRCISELLVNRLTWFK